MTAPPTGARGFRGPACWAVSGIVALALGAGLALIVRPSYEGVNPVVPLWLAAPFALLLASIALMPFVHARFWHHHYPDFAVSLGGFVAGYYLAGFWRGSYGPHHLLHALVEYYSFIALVGGLFVVSGGILVDVRGRGGPLANAALLTIGAVLANIVGTTGASMLLIRPFMRTNRGRLTPVHIVFFIFIVSNCGGCLTPIGDPPLYLGFLKGVPFLWTLEHLWLDWILVVALLVGAAMVYDLLPGRRAPATSSPLATSAEAARLAEAEVSSARGLRVRGGAGLLCLALMVAGVFIDPLLKRAAGIEGWPIGATVQIFVAAVAYRVAPRDILAANDFSFAPVKEVGLLFLGIFLTMTPALAYLAEHGAGLGIDTPTRFYIGTGALSAILDNAPTYLNFLQLAFGPADISPAAIATFLAERRNVVTLDAISTGAVFFGAMTYIGNGPNFMVKAIAEGAGVRMPTFFGYLVYAVLLLLPILVLHWAVFIR
jgi:Na+/H+ antiporter NhaD/arsenite permease-like protein